jgi:hypothetical protein
LIAFIMRGGSMLKSTSESASPPTAAMPRANASGIPSSAATMKNAMTQPLTPVTPS